MKKENNKTNKKLFSATAMLLLSAAMLGTATYAWFTMNKTVKVDGMELKAHAEEGLLINEVQPANSDTWDEQATANTTPETFALRPASTAEFTTWWHANSRKSADEAGVDALADTVDVDASGNKYTNISPANLTDNAVVTAAQAAGNTKAETHVYYSDASFGTSGSYQDGEGFYVKYTYYLKASSNTDLNVSAGNLGVTVNATKKNAEAATDLDKAIRVGVKIGSDTLIFAPVGGDTSYKVTGDAAGTAGSQISVTANNAKTGINASQLAIPNVNSPGLPVDVYVWFEGEDSNCFSDNLTAVLNSYQIDIVFTDDDL